MKNINKNSFIIFILSLIFSMPNSIFSNIEKVIENNKNLIENHDPIDNQIIEAKKSLEILGQSSFFFSTYGKDPYIRILKPSLEEIYIHKTGCFDLKTGESRQWKYAEDLENLAILKTTINIYGANIRINKRYKGDIESKIGKKLLDKLHSIAADGMDVFIDSYQQATPMHWIFNDAEELKAICKGLMTKFVTKQILPNKKIVLTIEILNDPELEKISAEDLEFLQKYFTLLPLTDKKVKEFFERNKKLMIDFTYNMINSGKTIYKKESILDGILRQFERHHKDFKAKDIAIWAGGILVTTSLWKLISGIFNGITKQVFDKQPKKPTPNPTEEEKFLQTLNKLIEKQLQAQNKEEDKTTEEIKEESTEQTEEDTINNPGSQPEPQVAN